MTVRPTQGYTGAQILLHWIIALLVVVQLFIGESMDEVMDAREDGDLASPADRIFAVMHYWVGIAVLMLTVLRLYLRHVLGTPSPTAQGWMKAAAELSHLAFYAVLLAMPITGLLGFYAGEPFDDIHQLGKPVLVVLISLHAAAALYHHFWLRDGTLLRMLVRR